MLLEQNLRQKILLRCSKTLETFRHFQKSSYVNVTMKWKKDPFFDSIEILSKSRDLRSLISLKNIIIAERDHCLPISAVSKRGRELDISGRVASFLRRYPSIFEEFAGPKHNLPWFRLTGEAFEIEKKEREIYLGQRREIVGRLRRLILMSRDKMLPLRIVQGMLWYLGLPEDFLENLEEISEGGLRVVEIGDDERWLCAEGESDGEILSVLQKNAMKQGSGDPIGFPLFRSKGLRLKKKIEIWLDGFQRLRYVSPYEDFSSLDPNSDVSEKRVVGVLHELLCIFVDNSAERRKLLCLRKYLGLPQKFHKVFERHPYVFYLHLKSKTCFVVLKEAFNGCFASAIERHPLLEVRKKYVELMIESEAILRSRRCRKPLIEIEDGITVNCDLAIEEGCSKDLVQIGGSPHRLFGRCGSVGGGAGGGRAGMRVSGRAFERRWNNSGRNIFF